VCVCVCIYIHTHTLISYRRVKSDAAVNWILVKANRCSGLKVVKNKESVGQETDLLVGCYLLCCWVWNCLVIPYLA